MQFHQNCFPINVRRKYKKLWRKAPSEKYNKGDCRLQSVNSDFKREKLAYVFLLRAARRAKSASKRLYARGNHVNMICFSMLFDGMRQQPVSKARVKATATEAMAGVGPTRRREDRPSARCWPSTGLDLLFTRCCSPSVALVWPAQSSPP